MGEHGRCPQPERLPQQDVLGRIGDVVLAPHDVGDSHIPVVDDVGQYKQRLTVGLAYGEILDGGIFVNDVAPDHVRPGGRARVGCPETQQAPYNRLQVPVSAIAVVTGGATGGLVALGDLFVRAVTGVDEVLIEQLLYGRLVQEAPLGLEVGPLVPVQAQPQHGPLDAFGVLGPVALGVGVLDAQHERARTLAGEEPVEQCRTGAADVEIARRRRGHADTGDTHGCQASAAPTPAGFRRQPGSTEPGSVDSPAQ
jgi:hypothetical protein